MDVKQTADGGYILTGHRGAANFVEDIYLLRTDSQGNEIWSRTFPGSFSGWGSEVVELPDGGFIASGVFEVNPQTHDSWAVRTDPDGNPIEFMQIADTSPQRATAEGRDITETDILKPAR